MMYKITRLTNYLLPMLTLFASCDKDHLFDCLKSSGSKVFEARTVGDFNRIDVYNNPEVIITQDTVNSVTVEAGEHIVAGITTECAYGTLTIRNENKCNWVRSYSKTIAVHVHVKKLDFIHHHGSSTISSANTLTNTTFEFNVWNSGDINLSIDADTTYSKQHITVGDITLSGRSAYCYIYNNGNGFTYHHDLRVENSTVIQRGTGDCYVNVNQNMNVEIHDVGDVYYSGNPQVTSSITGSGKLIHQ